MAPTALYTFPVRSAVSASIFHPGGVPARRMSPYSLRRSDVLLGRGDTIPQRITPPPWRRSASVVALFAQRKTKAKELDVVVPDPDYRIPLVLLGSAGFLAYQDNLLAAAPAGLLGLLLLFQTTRVRFVFDEEALEVKVGSELEESGENVFVGGKNRWKYSTFVNWELWWPNFPILVYFKETQTKPEGQVHFFPVIFNGKQLYDVMVERAGPSKTSGPKQD